MSDLIPSRVPGILIPTGSFPVPKTRPDPGEKNGRFYEDGGYVLIERDGTEVCAYPPEIVFVKQYADYVRTLRGRDVFQRLGKFIRQLNKRGVASELEVPLHELAVHPYNVRYKPVEEIPPDIYSQLLNLAGQQRLINPLIVTPVDQRIVWVLESIARQAKRHGVRSEDVLHGILYRKVEIREGRLFAREDDEVYVAAKRLARGAVSPEIRYLIVDGYLRYAASCHVLAEELDSFETVPEHLCIVARAKPAENVGMDPISAAYLSKTINLFERDLSVDSSASENFMALCDLSEAFIELGVALSLPELEEEGRAERHRASMRSRSIARPEVVIRYVMEPEPQGEVEEVEGARYEAEGRPGGGWSEQALVKSHDEGEARDAKAKQPAPAAPSASMPTAAPAVPAVSAPVAPAKAQELPVEPDRMDVLRRAIYMYTGDVGTLLAYLRGEVTIKFDHGIRSAFAQHERRVGERPVGMVRYIHFSNSPVKLNGTGVRVSGALPVYLRDGRLVRCPNPGCRMPLVLSPMRCLFCGSIVEDQDILPLPYEFRYRSEGT